MSSIGQLAGKIFDLIKEVEPEEQKKVMNAVSLLCGITTFAPNPDNETNSSSADASNNVIENDSDLNAAKYFANKSPKSKAEMLAVSARFSELKYASDSLESKDFSSIFSEARQNFDAKNFATDMRNAKDQGLFVKGGAKSRKHKLSYNGQNFVDALPERSEAKKHKKKVSNKKKKTAKKKITKKKQK